MSEVEQKGFFTLVYDGWLWFAELVGRFNTKIIVSLIYFCLVSFAWLYTATAMKKKPLLDRGFRISGQSAWKERGSKLNEATVEQLRHQFIL